MELNCYFIFKNRLLSVHGFIILTWCTIGVQMEFLLCFQRIHLSHIIGKWTFHLLCLHWVKRMKDQNVFCCIHPRRDGGVKSGIVATLALGSQPRQGGYKVEGQKVGSGVTSHVPRNAKSVREWTLTLPNELPLWEWKSQMDSRIFRAQLQLSKPINLKNFLHH